jgi:hypothetical protein
LSIDHDSRVSSRLRSFADDVGFRGV